VKLNEMIPELEEMLGFDAGTIKIDGNISDVPDWDSMAILTFIAFVEEKFDLVLDGDQIAGATTFKELFNLLGDKVE
jgi:acyl carrier protein